jgi:hypothetical protein
MATTWPADQADLWRTSAVCGGLVLEDGADPTTTTTEVPPYPMWAYTSDADHIFVLGGSPFGLNTFAGPIANSQYTDSADEDREDELIRLARAAQSQPYLAWIDTTTMTVEHTEYLIPFDDRTVVNYIGGALMLENGMGYVTALATLFEFDPSTGKVTRELALPLLGDPFSIFTAYQGLTVSPSTGLLLLKGSNILQIPPLATWLLVDPTTMTAFHQPTVDNIATLPRFSVTYDGTDEWIYTATDSQIVRLFITTDPFGEPVLNLDDSWTADYDFGAGTSSLNGVIPFPAEERVVVQNNAVMTNATTPMRFLWRSTQNNLFDQDTQSMIANGATPGGNFPALAGDPFVSGFFVTVDSLGKAAFSYRFMGNDDAPSPQWGVVQNRSAATPVSITFGHFYTDDRQCDPDGSNCTLAVTVLDLYSGDELSWIPVAGTDPSLGQMIVHGNALYYLASQTLAGGKGYVTKIIGGELEMSPSP